MHVAQRQGDRPAARAVGPICVGTQPAMSDRDRGDLVASSSMTPFLTGAAIGAAAGVVAGSLLSRHAVHLIAALIDAVDRRRWREEREQLRFELLLQ